MAKYPAGKTYHMAAMINEKGGVSSLCFKRARAINLRISSWTTREDAVTCNKCLVIMGGKP